MTQERDARPDLPGATTPPVEGPRWLWVKLGGWATALLLLAGAAWGVAWTATHVRVDFDLPRLPDIPRSETLPSYTVPPEPSSAPAPYMGDDGRAITNPAWAQGPEPAFPRAAQRAGEETGAVSLTCQTDAEGRMRACQIVEETPPGVGFGEETVKAAMKARVRPRLVDGQPSESEIAFTVRYRLD